MSLFGYAEGAAVMKGDRCEMVTFQSLPSICQERAFGYAVE